MEEKDRQNANMPVVKGKAVKGKVVKVKRETTPQGRRVIPRITSTMKAEATRKAVVMKGKKVSASSGTFFVLNTN